MCLGKPLKTVRSQILFWFLATVERAMINRLMTSLKKRWRVLRDPEFRRFRQLIRQFNREQLRPSELPTLPVYRLHRRYWFLGSIPPMRQSISLDQFFHEVSQQLPFPVIISISPFAMTQDTVL